MRVAIAITLALSLGAAALGADAQPLPGDPGAGAPRADFVALDRNHDG